MSQKVTARFIIEIAGKPKENVDKALKFVEKKLIDSKDFKVLDCEVVESEEDEKTTLFSGFLEATIKFKETKQLLSFILDYTPTSVEVEDPEKISFQAAELTDVLNHFSNHILKTTNEVRKLRAHIHLIQNQKQRETVGKKTRNRK